MFHIFMLALVECFFNDKDPDIPLEVVLSLVFRNFNQVLQIFGDWLKFDLCGAYGFTESMPFFLGHSLPGEVIYNNSHPCVQEPMIVLQKKAVWHNIGKFAEKPKGDGSWINGGFFIFEEKFFGPFLLFDIGNNQGKVHIYFSRCQTTIKVTNI